MTVDQLVAYTLAHPSAPDWPALVKKLRSSEQEIKASPLQDILRALDRLTLPMHLVGFACILQGACDGDKLKGDDARRFVRAWLTNVTREAAEHVVPEAAAICRAYVGDAMQSKVAALQVLQPLHDGLVAMQPSPEHMTPFHAAFLQAAVRAKSYYLGQKVLRQSLTCLSKTGLSISDYLLYGYYGALCCIGCKHYDQALELLRLVITTPTTCADAIITNAWYRYQVVAALHLGQPPSIPKATPYPTRRETRSSDPISVLVTHFLDGKLQEFDTLVKTEEKNLNAAGMHGLVMQMRDKMITHSIKKLTSTFVTLSLSDIATRAKLGSAEEAEHHILKMIDAREVCARIDEEAGMVRFLDEDPADACMLMGMLQERVKTIAALQDRLTQATRATRLDRSCVAGTMHLAALDKSGAGDAYFGSSSMMGDQIEFPMELGS